jgi:hypothetical protein
MVFSKKVRRSEMYKLIIKDKELDSIPKNKRLFRIVCRLISAGAPIKLKNTVNSFEITDNDIEGIEDIKLLYNWNMRARIYSWE